MKRHMLWVTKHLSRLPKEIYDKLMGSVCVSEWNTPCLSKTRISVPRLGSVFFFSCIEENKIVTKLF